MQQNIHHMVARRKRIFWGRVLDGTSPAIPPYKPPLHPAALAAGA
jgi:hypothetical protein